MSLSVVTLRVSADEARPRCRPILRRRQTSDNVSSPQRKPLGGYGENTQKWARDNGGTARVLSDVFITQRDASCGRNPAHGWLTHPEDRLRVPVHSWEPSGSHRRLTSGHMEAMERSIHEIYQAFRHNQTLRPTLGISFASRSATARSPSRWSSASSDAGRVAEHGQGAAFAAARGGRCVPGSYVPQRRVVQGTGRRCWLRRLPLVVKTPPHASRTEQVRQMSR